MLILPKGQELNDGPSEESDSVIIRKPTLVEIIGNPKDGAVKVLDHKDDRVYFLHLPEKLFSRN